MQIRFNEHTFTVSTKEVEGVEMFSLKDIENGWKAGKPEGASLKAIKEWNESPATGELIQLGEITLVKKEGRYGGTWGCKDALVEYASHCSVPFRSAVRKAFLAAAEGDANKAVDIATSVVIDPKLIEREKALRETLSDVIKTMVPEDKQKFAFMNYNKLMSKCFSGFTPKQLTDSRMSAFQYAVHLGHTDGVGAYLACLEMSISALASGVDYHTLALMLKVETSKNKKLMKLIK